MLASIIQLFIMPSSVALIFIILGAVAIYIMKRRLGLTLILSGILIVFIFSTGPVATLLISPLEYRYPMVSAPSNYPDAKYIVVLTGYAAKDKLMPLSSQANSASVFRVLEAYHLYQQRPDCQIIISGTPVAVDVMRELLVELGIPETDITGESNSPHTFFSAKNLKPIINNVPFFLVTSAGHMTRSMGVFHKQNMKPIPAPTDYQLPRDFRKAMFRPTLQHLYYSELAIHEYIGLIWYRWKGWI
ncbi:MAG: YdcF family protein [Gammaproteobacteria bacterium]|nr:YdcF family protein [Gammaproteobacteria bacterium]